ncbi:hypothetical protein [Sinimarinibacterium thermocellulolyticum]|uniref:Uncharacterized protein n=1 Tax=Sinimarinibacterium thermocellulolyticum TaxID=3170016 RepID=A0ABV2A9A1_9GAMM
MLLIPIIFTLPEPASGRNGGSFVCRLAALLLDPRSTMPRMRSSLSISQPYAPICASFSLALALMLSRGTDGSLMSAPDCVLRSGDRILFCGRDGTRGDMEMGALHSQGLGIAVTSSDVPDALVWRRLSQRRGRIPTAADGS